jgi:hypothetical protein
MHRNCVRKPNGFCAFSPVQRFKAKSCGVICLLCSPSFMTDDTRLLPGKQTMLFHGSLKGRNQLLRLQTYVESTPRLVGPPDLGLTVLLSPRTSLTVPAVDLQRPCGCTVGTASCCREWPPCAGVPPARQ